MPGCRSTGLLCKAGYLSPEEALPGPAAWLLGWSQPASLFGVRESRTCVCLCLAMQLRAYIYLGLAQAENMCLLARKKRPPTAGSSPLLYQAVCTFPQSITGLCALGLEEAIAVPCYQSVRESICRGGFV